VNITKESKELLDEYAYQNKMTVSKALDTLVGEGAKRYFEMTKADEPEAV
jgi:hypothetical protein